MQKVILIKLEDWPQDPYAYIVLDSKKEEEIKQFLKSNFKLDIEDETKNMVDLENEAIDNVIKKLEKSGLECEIIYHYGVIEL